MDRFAEQPIQVFMANGSPIPDNFAEILTEALAQAGIDWCYA